MLSNSTKPSDNTIQKASKDLEQSSVTPQTSDNLPEVFKQVGRFVADYLAYEQTKKLTYDTGSFFVNSGYKMFEKLRELAMVDEPGTYKQTLLFDEATTKLTEITNLLNAAKTSNLTPKQKTEIINHYVLGKKINLSTDVLKFVEDFDKNNKRYDIGLKKI